MLTLSAAARLEKNRMATGGVFLVLLDLILPEDVHVRVCQNNENVTWGGYEWAAFPFELDAVVSSPRGELPSLNVRISNITRIIEGYMAETSGGLNSQVTFRVINSQYMGLTKPELEETFDIIASSADAQWVTLSLGMPNPLLQRFPLNRYFRDNCRWVFKGVGCGYVGAETTCNHTLNDCRFRNNELRFGGFPGIPGGALYKL